MEDKALFQEMQDEELQAIQAIYMDDCIWHTSENSCGPHEISLRLTPLQSMVGTDVHVKVDLRVQYTSSYPNDPPILHLENAKGLSSDLLQDLKQTLDKMALASSGEVMVLQLAQFVQSFLHKHNVPNLSFYEQMLRNKRSETERRKQEEKMRKELAMAEGREEEEDVIRQVKEELHKREEEKRKRQVSGTQVAENLAVAALQSPVLQRQKFFCPLANGRKASHTVFCVQDVPKTICAGSCCGHFFEGACLLPAIALESGELFSVCEWVVKLQNGIKKNVQPAARILDESTLQKQVQNIEQEMSYISSKLDHPSLVRYHAFHFEQSKDSLVAKVLLDHFDGASFASILQEPGLSLPEIQDVARQLLDVLGHLHQKSVIHRNLRLSTTFCTAHREVKVAGYSVLRRISDLCGVLGHCSDISDPGHLHDEYRKLIKSGKKGDVFYLGVMLLCLQQREVIIKYPLEVPSGISEQFQDFLNKCLDVDEKTRFSVQQLAKHPFILMKVTSMEPPMQGGPSVENENKQATGHSDSDFQTVPFIGDFVLMGQSRLLNEFELQEHLGKGGFGSVIKVRNRLDGNLYAIKRIQLNPKSFQLNKRITREVKLLSRLNHENVVRYYNSWIEAEDVDISIESSTADTSSGVLAPKPEKAVPASKLPFDKQLPSERHPDESLWQLNGVAFEEPGFARSSREDDSWNDVAVQSGSRSSSSSSSSSSSVCLPVSKSSAARASSSFMKYGDSSDCIVFQTDESVLQFGDLLDSEDSVDEAETPATCTNSTTEPQPPLSVQYLYIQMEYCEKSTLRNVIDEGLYSDTERVWRLFREIVEGLAHVHGQGIIHRDLKPVNIFMDSRDHVKIGDFGLATSHTSTKIDAPLFLDDTSLQSATDDRMTGKVGTFLYVAPELGQGAGRVKFSQKVDLYSLGIILFEMLYKPLQTAMERVKTISLLRTERIALPDELLDKKLSRERFVLLWLLNHNPDSRPTAQELLESGYVPPKIEDRQLDELLRHTLSQTNSTRYQRLMTALFSQSVSPVADQIYDSDCHGKNASVISRNSRLVRHVSNKLDDLFSKHGAVFIPTPLLVPKTKLFDQLSNVATLLDSSGLLVALPYDSRISFARYVSRNNISSIRRYYLGRVLRDQTVMGAHPSEILECSFDIVTETWCNNVPEAEVIYSVYEIIQLFPGLRSRNFFVRVSHLSLTKAIFLSLNFADDLQCKLFRVLETCRSPKLREAQLREQVTEADHPEHIVTKFISLISVEGSMEKAKESLQVLRKSKGSISSLTKQALQSLDLLIRHLALFGVDIPIYICSSLAVSSSHYSGIVFQIVAENTRKKKHGGVDILAVGGQYDKLVEQFSKYAEVSSVPAAVGVSIAVEKILGSVAAEDTLVCTTSPSVSSVLVCSVGTPFLSGLLQVLSELWSADVSATLYSYDPTQSYTVEEVCDFAKGHGVSHVLVLKETEPEYVRMRILDKEKFCDVRVLRKDVHKLLTPHQNVRHEVSRDSEDSRKATAYDASPQINVHFVLPDHTKEKSLRKYYEDPLLHKYRKVFEQRFGGGEVHVVAAGLSKAELKTISAFIEVSGTAEDFESSVADVTESLTENRPYIKRVCAEVKRTYDATMKECSSSSQRMSKHVFILYSFKLEIYRILS